MLLKLQNLAAEKGFVSTPAIWNFEDTYCTSRIFAAICSRMKWTSSSISLVRLWNTELEAKASALMLSHDTPLLDLHLGYLSQTNSRANQFLWKPYQEIYILILSKTRPPPFGYVNTTVLNYHQRIQKNHWNLFYHQDLMPNQHQNKLPLWNRSWSNKIPRCNVPQQSLTRLAYKTYILCLY